MQRTMPLLSALSTLLSLAAIAGATGSAHADEYGVSSEAVQAEHVLASLGSPVRQAAAGERIPLIISLQADEEWHLYWSNPGDSGMPPRITLDLPEGVSQDGDWKLPPPRHLIAGGMGTLVLDHDVVLVTYLTIAEDFTSEHISITANGQWLVCDDHMCLPGNASLSLDIPMNDDLVRAHEGPWQERLERAHSLAPQPLSEQPGLSYAEGTITLTISEDIAAQSASFIVAPTRNRIINLGSPQSFTRAEDEGGSLEVRSAFRETPEALEGLLVALNDAGYPIASWHLAAPFPQP